MESIPVSLAIMFSLMKELGNVEFDQSIRHNYLISGASDPARKRGDLSTTFLFATSDPWTARI